MYAIACLDIFHNELVISSRAANTLPTSIWKKWYNLAITLLIPNKQRCLQCSELYSKSIKRWILNFKVMIHLNIFYLIFAQMCCSRLNVYLGFKNLPFRCLKSSLKILKFKLYVLRCFVNLALDLWQCYGFVSVLFLYTKKWVEGKKTGHIGLFVHSIQFDGSTKKINTTKAMLIA